MGWYKGRKPPASLPWQDIDRILKNLDAEYLSTEGDHRKYCRKTKTRSFYITLPTYSDFSVDLLKSIIHQTGISQKEFWKVYFEGKKTVKTSTTSMVKLSCEDEEASS